MLSKARSSIKKEDFNASSIVERLMIEITRMYTMLSYFTVKELAMDFNYSYIHIYRSKLKREIFALRLAQLVTYYLVTLLISELIQLDTC